MKISKIVFYLNITLLISCGFQINYNQPQLPKGAKSIFIFPIENQTFTANAQTKLKIELLSLLSNSKKINVKENDNADLTLNIQIKKYLINRVKYSLTENQNYEFTINVSAILLLKDNRNQTNIFNNISVSGSYKIKTSDNKLNQFDQLRGEEESLNNLANNIYQKITQQF